MASDKAIRIIAMASVTSSNLEALKIAQVKLVTATIKEKGCLEYELHKCVNIPGLLIFVEKWESEESWRAHMGGLAVQEFQASGAGRFIDDFQLFHLNLISNGK